MAPVLNFFGGMRLNDKKKTCMGSFLFYKFKNIILSYNKGVLTIYTNILKGVREPGTVPRGALLREF